MPLPAADPDCLNLWLFGPGFGELVLVCAPPGRWLVVDGCNGGDDAGYAQRALDAFGAKPSLVLLSHPHKDHADGLREVIERATPAADMASWPMLGMVPAPGTPGAGDAWDAVAALEGGVAEQVVATVLERWRQHAACRWDLGAGTSQALGEASVLVLSPTDAERDAAVRAWLAKKKHNYNRAASALLVTWRGRRVLLGSDLVEAEGHGWTLAMGHDPNLRAHDVYKLAHHGSINAIGPQVEKAGPLLRTWIATPFSKGFKGLPRMDDGQGLDKLLAVEDPVDLTGLPRERALQSARSEDRTRAFLRDDPDEAFASTTTGFPDCWLYLRLPPRGPVHVERGPGSIRVHA